MLPDVAVPNYQDVYNQLGSTYDPQTQQVQSQIDQLAPQQQAQQASLDQAKVNAFRDITNSANAKGVLFSGFTPDQQATYTGTKYLPAVANLQATFNNTKNTLLDKINQINAQRSQQAQGAVSAAQKAAQDTAYRNAQLNLGQQRVDATYAGINARSANSAQNAADKAASQYSLSKFKNGNYSFTGANKQPITFAQYATGAGLDANGVKSVLANGSNYDKNIYNSVKGINDPAQLAAAIKRLDKGNFYGFN